MRFPSAAWSLVPACLLLGLLLQSAIPMPVVSGSASASASASASSQARAFSTVWDAVPIEPRSIAVPSSSSYPPPVILVVACSNRTSLAAALPSWLRLANLALLVLVDWNSVPPLVDSLAPVVSSDPELAALFRRRAVLVRVPDVQGWVLTWAYNLAFRVARAHLQSIGCDASLFALLKCDCDTLVHPEFPYYHPLDTMNYYSGDWQHARNPNEIHLNGVFYTLIRHIWDVNGYDERIQSYGWDDSDLYSRLNALGLNSSLLDYEYIEHEEHPAAQRRASSTPMRCTSDPRWSPEVNSLLPQMRVEFHIQKNRVLSKFIAPWGTHDQPTVFELELVEGPIADSDSDSDSVSSSAGCAALQSFTAHLVSSPGCQEAFVQDISALQRAVREPILIRLAKLSFKYWALPRPYLSDDSLMLRYLHVFDLNARTFTVHVQHGLSNRLRALGSAMAIAAASNRRLRVIWEADSHCQALFTHLFKPNAQLFDVWSEWRKEELSMIPRDLLRQYNYMEYERGKKNEYIDGKHGIPHIYFKSAYRGNHELGILTSAISAQLNKLELSDAVSDLLRSHGGSALTGNVKFIGVHIRNRDPTTEHVDHTYTKGALKVMIQKRRQSSLEAFVPVIRRKLQDLNLNKMFVATDSPELYPRLDEVFGADNVLRFSAAPCPSRSAQCVQRDLADQLVLSRSELIVGSPWSSYSEVAAMWRTIPIITVGESESGSGALPVDTADAVKQLDKDQRTTNPRSRLKAPNPKGKSKMKVIQKPKAKAKANAKASKQPHPSP